MNIVPNNNLNRLIMKKSLLWLMLIVVLLSSCVTQKACDRKYPPQNYIISKDSTVIKDSTIYSYAEIPVYIKGDTVVKHDTVIKDKQTGLINSKPVYAETEFAKATAQVVNSKLKLELIQKDSTFKIKTDSLLKEVYHWKELYKSKDTTTVKEVKVVPKVYSIFGLIGLISVITLIAYLIFKLRGLFNLNWPR